MKQLRLMGIGQYEERHLKMCVGFSAAWSVMQSSIQIKEIWHLTPGSATDLLGGYGQVISLLCISSLRKIDTCPPLAQHIIIIIIIRGGVSAQSLVKHYQLYQLITSIFMPQISLAREIYLFGSQCLL